MAKCFTQFPALVKDFPHGIRGTAQRGKTASPGVILT